MADGTDGDKKTSVPRQEATEAEGGRFTERDRQEALEDGLRGDAEDWRIANDLRQLAAEVQKER